MTRLLTVTGLAAMFAVGLAAQSTTGTSGTTTQDPQTTTAGGGGQRGGGPRTITGCLRAGDTAGTYMLTNVEGMGGRRGGMGGNTTTSGTTTSGTTTGTAAAGNTATAGGGTMGQGRGMNSIMLNADSGVDLKEHVGHKIEVTGTFAGGRRGGMNGGATSTTTSTAGGTSTGASTAGGSTMGQGGRGMRSMTVTAVKMVSDSCS